MASSFKKRPSYKQGFARSAGESKYPNLWRGLVGAWVPALGVTGGTLYDQGRYGEDGTLTTMVPASDWVATPDGYALNFDGTSDRVVTPASKWSDTPDVTVMALVKPTSGASGLRIISSLGSAWGSATIDWYLAAHDVGSGGLQFNTYRHTSINSHTSGVSIYDGASHIVAATLKDSTTTSKIYIDGKQAGSDNASHSSYSATDEQIILGARPGGGAFFWSGDIGLVYVWDRVLSDSELKFLNDNPFAPFELADVPFGYSIAAQTLIGGILSYNHPPSYHQGFARSAGRG